MIKWRMMNVVKFLHTADWHLGKKYVKLGEKAEEARKIRIKSAENLLENAKSKNVDFVIISGDLFDNNDVDRNLTYKVTKILAKINPTPIYILPGNHDPLTLDSLYLDPVWDSVQNVEILKDYSPLELPDINVTLYPCPLKQKRSNNDPTEDIKVLDESISIGIAHGNVEIVEDGNFPINPQRAEKSGLDYLALGDWHSFNGYKCSDGIVRTVYPGTPETTNFKEKSSGTAAIVAIDSHKSDPNIQKLDTGLLKWMTIPKNVHGIQDIQIMENELKNFSNPNHHVLKFSLKGTLDQEAYNYLEYLKSKYTENFMYIELLTEKVYLKPNIAEFKLLIPEGAILERTFEALMALMKNNPEMQSLSDISSERASKIIQDMKENDIKDIDYVPPEVLNHALSILYQMTKEASE